MDYTLSCSDHSDPLIPKGVLEENGVKFKFTVYQRKTEST